MADDLEDDIQAMLKRLGLELPPLYKLADCTRPIETVGDMVEWMAWARDKCDPIT